MRKNIVNENWELEEVLDLNDLCAVLYKYGSNDAGYVEAFDFDDCKMKDAYNNLVSQYQEANADDLVHIYLVKLPSTNQVLSLLNSALYNGNERVPEAIEAVNALCNRADCETLSSWNGCLTEDKKKKKVCSSSYCGFTDPELNIRHFNQCMGTGGLQNPNSQHLVVGDVLPNAPVADTGSSDGASDTGNSSTDEGGAMGESLNEENNLTEAHIDYNEQVEKMRRLEIKLANPSDPEGRGFNTANVSLDKLRVNYDICIDRNFKRARNYIENVLREKGWGQYIKPTKIARRIVDYNYIGTDPKYFSELASKTYWRDKDNPDVFIKDYGNSIEDLLVLYIFAKVDGNINTVRKLGAYIVEKFTITQLELINFAGLLLQNTSIAAVIEQQLNDRRAGGANTSNGTAARVSPSGAVIFDIDELKLGLCGLVNKHAEAEPVINYCLSVTGTIRNLLMALIYAICLKKDAAFIESLKRTIVINCSYGIDLIKETIKDCLGNTDKLNKINELIERAKSLKTESLKEDFLDDLEANTNTYTVDGVDYTANELYEAIWDSIDSYRFDADDEDEYVEISQLDAEEVAHDAFYELTDQNCKKPIYEVVSDLLGLNESLKEDVKLDEAKRYVKRYYVRPQNIFCSNKEDILKALLRVEGENCSVYSLKNLSDHDDVQELQPSDIIYYYDDGILYDKNHVKVMDYDLNVKHEEERKKFANVDAAPESQVNDVYDDRLTDADLKDKEAVANFRAINQRQMK